MPKTPTNRDVAVAAKVSTGTVSNVLHRPHLVSGGTRVRVERAMLGLGFGREELAASGSRSLRCRPAPRAGVPAREELPHRHASPPPRNQDSGPGWQDIPLLRAVTVHQRGVLVGSGLAECTMPDGSGIWVRFDDGRGRLLLTRDEGYEIRCS